jgi:hypothetical protein
MATYRKKKRNPGPSKNEEKVERARQAEAMNRTGNSVGARFPEVGSLKITLAFTGAQGQSFGEVTKTYKPQDPCDFATPCPGRCGVGSFDLASKIAAVVTAHEMVSEGSGVCQEKPYAGATEPCGCTLKARVEATYRSIPSQPA